MTERITPLLETTARIAGEELRKRFGHVRHIEKKGAINLVTEADRASEEICLKRLAADFPGVPVLAEESGQHGAAHSDLWFTVDPLDGTTNYAHGIPQFAVTIAAVDASGVLAGVVYDPIRDEMYRATRGQGAFCGEERLHVSATASLDDATLETGFPYDLRSRADDLLGYFSDFLRASRAIRRFGSAAIDLAWVAQGRFDGYFEHGLKAWDIAAGILLVTEAGGVVSDYRGRPVELHGGEILAATPAVYREMLEITRRRAESPKA